MRKLIVDTDIGDDIDDIWALMLLFATNMFDVAMISITNGDIEYKTKLVAKILTKLKLEHIAIAKGISNGHDNLNTPQADYLNDFDFASYEGKIYETYEEAYREVLASGDSYTVVGLGPFTSLAQVISLLKKTKTNLVAMAGSVHKGYFNSDTPVAECNIVTDIDASKKVFESGISIVMLPLDVCGNIRLHGYNYELIKNSNIDFAKIAMDNYLLWQEVYTGGALKYDIDEGTSILYDLIPIWYLIYPQNFDVVDMPIMISDKGETLVGGDNQISVALHLHKRDVLEKFSSEQMCTKRENNYSLKIMGIEGRYKLAYSKHSNNVFLSVYETGWEHRRPGSNYGPSRREYYIMHLVTQGKGEVTIGNKTYCVTKGDCFLLPPDIMTYYVADDIDPFSYYWVGFNGIEAKEMVKKIGFVENENYVITPKKYDLILEKLQKMDAVLSTEAAAEYIFIGNLFLLFAEMIEEKVDEEVIGRDYVSKALQYMNANYQSNISINDVASYVAIERTYFFRMFKKQVGISPQTYLINLKFERTKILLRESKKSIVEIAFEVGYPNYVSFIKMFKKKSGMTPSEFRKIK